MFNKPYALLLCPKVYALLCIYFRHFFFTSPQPKSDRVRFDVQANTTEQKERHVTDLLTPAIQPQRQLATEQEKRETNMHTYKQAKPRLDVDAKMIGDELHLAKTPQPSNFAIQRGCEQMSELVQ